MTENVIPGALLHRPGSCGSPWGKAPNSPSPAVCKAGSDWFRNLSIVLAVKRCRAYRDLSRCHRGACGSSRRCIPHSENPKTAHGLQSGKSQKQLSCPANMLDSVHFPFFRLYWILAVSVFKQTKTLETGSPVLGIASNSPRS